MIKISKKNYDRLLAQAEELKLMNKTKLANNILNMVGPLHKEADSDNYSETTVYDLKGNLEQDLFEILVKNLDVLNKNIDVDSVEKLAKFYRDRILSDLTK